MLALDLTRYTHETAGGFFEIAAEIHAEVYNEPLFGNHPFFSESAFRQGYSMALRQPRFELLTARFEGREVGYMYGFALQPEAGWWDSIEWSETVLAGRPDNYSHEDGNRTVVIPEILVKSPLRRMGIARSMHDEFLSHRREQRAGLLVLPNNHAAKSAYLKWGWCTIGMVRRVPEAPLYECMVKSLD
ncbi:MAG: GNAT family N-acetyltransferase [Pseudonocardiaceae bacterium]